MLSQLLLKFKQNFLHKVILYMCNVLLHFSHTRSGVCNATMCLPNRWYELPVMQQACASRL